MDTDILKPDTGYLTVIERRIASNPGSQVPSGPSSRSGSGSSSSQIQSYVEPESEGEDDDVMVNPAKDEDRRTGLSGDEVKAAVAYREKMLEERQGMKTPAKPTAVDPPHLGTPEGNVGSPTPSNGKRRALLINPLAPSSEFDAALKQRVSWARDDNREGEIESHSEPDQEGRPRCLDDEETGENRDLSDRILSRDWSAPAGKKIAIPIRIEPKVYFAAERTFLVVPCRYFYLTH